MYKRILLTLDGSAMAEQALPHAVAHAERFQAELILLKVQEPLARSLSLPPSKVKEAEDLTRELAGEYLEKVASDVRESGITVRTVIAEGHPHEKIVLFAKSQRVDLIVICTRKYSGLSRWLRGSVADRVTRGVYIPVLLVRACKEHL